MVREGITVFFVAEQELAFVIGARKIVGLRPGRQLCALLPAAACYTARRILGLFGSDRAGTALARQRSMARF